MSEQAESLTAIDDKQSADMEGMLELLDTKVESVMTQVEKVRATRGLILAVSRRLHESLRLCGEGADQGSAQEQALRQICEEVQRREEVLRELETREVLLSHSVMNAITSWARVLEQVRAEEDEEGVYEDEGVHEDEDEGEGLGESGDTLHEEEPLYGGASESENNNS